MNDGFAFGRFPFNSAAIKSIAAFVNRLCFRSFVTVRNEVVKVMFLQVSALGGWGLLPGGSAREVLGGGLLRGVPGPSGVAWSDGGWYPSMH